MSGFKRLKHSVVAAALLAIAACGGGGGDGPTVQPPSPPPPPPPPPAGAAIDVEPAFPGVSFAQPVSLVHAPGDAARWFVVEQQGIVRAFDNDPAVSQSSVFLDITGRVNDTFSESGLLGIAFHPAFPSPPDVFVNYTTGDPLVSHVSRFSLDPASGVLDPASEQLMLRVPQPAANHNAGDLLFGPEAEPTLYASFGDGGGSGDPGENAQNTSNLLGTIVRIEVDSADPYGLPTGNPFLSQDVCATEPNTVNPCPEIYAWGLRNPWRISVDPATGNIWIGDVGQSSLEEVDRIDATQDPLNRDFGWDDQEGTSCFEPPSGCDTSGLPPVAEYGRTLGQSITGGYVYRGTAIPDLVGTYVFGDFGSGRIFGIAADSQPTVTPDELLESGFAISTFATDVDGELYVVDYGSGTIHAIIPAP